MYKVIQKVNLKCLGKIMSTVYMSLFFFSLASLQASFIIKLSHHKFLYGSWFTEF